MADLGFNLQYMGSMSRLALSTPRASLPVLKRVIQIIFVQSLLCLAAKNENTGIIISFFPKLIQDRLSRRLIPDLFSTHPWPRARGAGAATAHLSDRLSLPWSLPGVWN